MILFIWLLCTAIPAYLIAKEAETVRVKHLLWLIPLFILGPILTVLMLSWLISTRKFWNRVIWKHKQ